MSNMKIKEAWKKRLKIRKQAKKIYNTVSKNNEHVRKLNHIYLLYRAEATNYYLKLTQLERENQKIQDQADEMLKQSTIEFGNIIQSIATYKDNYEWKDVGNSDNLAFIFNDDIYLPTEE